MQVKKFCINRIGLQSEDCGASCEMLHVKYQMYFMFFSPTKIQTLVAKSELEE